ncbi:MAG: enoyl-CoA hydratase/isomerase family protein [Rhodobacteraceae bacterium]|nr:enoyl-CoA hydratase/isomerase family protein [Paracoccaceae bacterium]
MTGRVGLERHGRVALLRIARPEALNAIDEGVCADFLAHAAALAADATVGAAVVAGTGGRALSAGADLATVARLSGPGKRRFIESAWRALDALARLPVPVIAAIEGYALGGGLELALACDLRVADPDAVMGLPEMALGSVPSFGAVQRLPGIVGRGRAVELMLGGRRIDGREAERIGLVNRLAPPGQTVATAMAMAEDLAARPREAVRYLKLALDGALAGPAAAELHGLVSDACHADPAYQARISRFAARGGGGSG